jgi:hypothetical protein
MTDNVEKVENRAARKSREGRLLGLSAAARFFKPNTKVAGRVYANRCGPSRRCARNASNVAKAMSLCSMDRDTETRDPMMHVHRAG